MFLFNLLSVFSRAKNHQALTPSERAFLRGVDAYTIFLFITAITAAAPYLSGSRPFSMQGLITTMAPAFFQAFGVVLVKLWKAQGDNGIGLIPASGDPSAAASSTASESVTPALSAANGAPSSGATSGITGTAAWTVTPAAPPSGTL